MKILWAMSIAVVSIQAQTPLIPMRSIAAKRYNEVAYASAHNGQSHIPSPVSNQDCPIAQQLSAGIRAIKIPVWYGCNEQGNSVAYACHGVSKTLLEDVYLGNLIEKVPCFFRPYARKLFRTIQPIDQLVIDGLATAYGKTDTEVGAIPFNHAILDPAGRPLIDVLTEVRTFLASHPDDIVTLILEDFMANRSLIADAVHQSGLYAYLHTQAIDKEWPTIGELLDRGTRLIIFVRSADSTTTNYYPWLHNLWSFAWDTRWDFKKISDFNYDNVPNRGKESFEERQKPPYNKLFIVYHFITPLTGGSKYWAYRVNKQSVLGARLRRLQEETGHIPNFIQVDFFEYPNQDVISVINRLNMWG